MKRYRFKTLEEFGGRRPLTWSPSMDKYLGQKLDLTATKQREIDSLYGTSSCFRYEAPDGDNWSYLGTDLVEITNKKINMKRIHKQDWEELDLTSIICGVEMQNGNKFYLLWNVDGFVPVNLKVHSSTSYSDTSDVELGLASMSETNSNKKLFRFDTMKELIEWATT